MLKVLWGLELCKFVHDFDTVSVCLLQSAVRELLYFILLLSQPAFRHVMYNSPMLQLKCLENVAALINLCPSRLFLTES